MHSLPVRPSSAAKNTWAEQKDRLGSQFQFITADYFLLLLFEQSSSWHSWKAWIKILQNSFFLLLIAFETPASETSSTAIVLLVKFEIISTRMHSVLFQPPGTCSVCRVDCQSKPSHAMWCVSKCITKTSEEGLLGVSSSWENFQRKWFAFVPYASLCVYLRSCTEMWACSWLTQRQRYCLRAVT